ncbi:MAG: heterodisulfide reductase subunit B, partial [Candidatus Cloacimonadota bacterium]
MKYAYYPGCSLETSAKEYDLSIREVFKKLGIELVELEDWSCCGSTPGHMTSELLSASLSLRNSQLAAGMGLELVVPCVACLARIRYATETMRREPEFAKKVMKVLNVTNMKEVNTRHPLEIFLNEYGLEKIEPMVERKLNGLKVAPYYGCLLVRPPEVMKFDDPENPTSLDDLCRIVGAVPIEWQSKMECCGAILALSSPDIQIDFSLSILEKAKIAGADIIVLACPLCHSNLETTEVTKKVNMPVLYYSQLLGIGLGISAKSLGLERNLISPFEVLSDYLRKEEVIE